MKNMSEKILHKRGISLIALLITIIVALILIATSVITATKAVDNANIITFIKDLTEIQNAAEEYYLTNNVMPVLIDSDIMSKDAVVAITEPQSLFIEELTENGDMGSEFYTIDLAKINVTKIAYGYKKLGENDIFVIAYPTMNVYYPHGLDAKGTTYFSITSKISGETEVLQNQTDTSSTSVISSSGITVTKIDGWTNSMGISISADMASDEELYISVSGGTNHLIITTIGPNAFGFNLLSSLSNGTETMKLQDNLSIDEVAYIESGTKPVEERYVDIIKYKGSEYIGKVRIDLSKFSKTIPTIDTSNNSYYPDTNMIKLTVSNITSGIREIRYEYLTKYTDDANIVYYYSGVSDFDSAYMLSRGKRAEISNGTSAIISTPKNIQKIKVLVKDNAGNIGISFIDIAPELYIGYSLDSVSRSTLQLTTKVYSSNGVNKVTFSKSVDGVNFDGEQEYILNTTTNGITTKQCTAYTGLTSDSVYIKIAAVNYDSTITETRIIKANLLAIPIIVASPTDWTNGNVTVSIAYSPDATAKKYSTDSADWNTYVTPIVVSKNETTIYAKETDTLGVESNIATLTISNIDKSLPTIIYGTNGKINYLTTGSTTASTTVTAVDEGGSNLNGSTLQYVWDTQNITIPISGWTTFTNGATITRSGITDTYYLWIKAEDNSGNIVISKSNAFIAQYRTNKPDLIYLPATTKAIKWDASNNESEIALATAATDMSWYDYAAKKWANVKTSNNGNDAYWVWIPRYAYKIDSPHTATAQQINIIFLAGTSNNPADGTALPSGYIVHPAFTFDDKQLPGIWVAKYEGSSSNPAALYGGSNDTSLQVRVLPSVYSWRFIIEGNMQTVCMNMTSASGSLGTTTNLDTHQMKNIEWGAVAYLTQSIYGTEPWINPYGDLTEGSYKYKTGYSGQSKDSAVLAEGNVSLHPYNDLTYGVNASTTGNIYGIYDISGGAFEYTAAFIDNGNSQLGSNGTSTFFTNNVLKPEYTKYYDIYEPTEEEKLGGTYYGDEGAKLYSSTSPYNLNEESSNIIRKRLTDGTYFNGANKKGDAIYEVSSQNSYYGRYTSGGTSSAWLIDTVRAVASGQQCAINWNNDYMLLGYGSAPWFMRGGYAYNNIRAGAFYTYAVGGFSYGSYGFRPVLVSGLGL